MLDEHNGTVIATGGPQREDARLLRAQAYAPHEPSGLRITGYLLDIKIRGQANVIRDVFRAANVARMLDEYADAVTGAPSLDDMRMFEGHAAIAYWAVWAERVRIPWRNSDLDKIPERWTRFQGRSSLLWDTPSNMAASDPANAMLNYTYTVAATEATHLCHALGLSPILGVLHADKVNRDSMALDLIECIRPVCDRLVLALMDTGLGAKPLDRRWFTESYQGQAWLVPPLTHMLASYAAQIGAELRPYAEHVARTLAHEASGDVKIPRARKAKRAAWQTETGRAVRAVPRLRDGITSDDIIPDSVWSEVSRFIPEPPRKSAGRPPNGNERDAIAGLAVHELLGVPWSEIPLQVSASTYRARKLEYEWTTVNGSNAWQHIAEIIQAAGHLSALVI
jgi:CRISPR-associated endonuclease Cas1